MNVDRERVGRHRPAAGVASSRRRLVGVLLVVALVGAVLAGYFLMRGRASAPNPSAVAASTSPVLASPIPSTASPTPSPTPTPTPSKPPRAEPSLVGNTNNAWAFAPLDDPSNVTIEGSVPSQRSWSTSKVLVTAAFLQQVVGGDPSQLSETQHAVITKALTESDGNSIIWLHNAIPGGSGDPVNSILRSIGDNETWWPNSAMNTSTWTIDHQLSFLIALHEGRVVNPAVSQFLISMMRPVPSESWGLGTVGATAFKGGWVSAGTETRQMGFLDGYAVVIITAGEGPAILQIDGDSAHVDQMNNLAAQLHQRLQP